ARGPPITSSCNSHPRASPKTRQRSRTKRTLPWDPLPSPLPLVDAELLRALHLHHHSVLDDLRHRSVAQAPYGGAGEIARDSIPVVRHSVVAVPLRPHPCSYSVEASGRGLPHLRRACRGGRVGSRPSEKPSTASTHLPRFPTCLVSNRGAKVE